MDKLKSAMKTLGKVANTMAENHQREEEMINELMKRTYGVDREQARKIAHVLLTQAEVTWK